MGVAFPLQFLALLDDGLDVLCVDAADQRLDLVGVRDDLFVLIVFLVVVVAEVSQLFDAFDELRLVVQFGLPFVEIELLQNLQQLQVELVIAFVPTCRKVLKNLLLELHPPEII